MCQPEQHVSCPLLPNRERNRDRECFGTVCLINSPLLILFKVFITWHTKPTEHKMRYTPTTLWLVCTLKAAEFLQWMPHTFHLNTNCLCCNLIEQSRPIFYQIPGTE